MPNRVISNMPTVCVRETGSFMDCFRQADKEKLSRLRDIIVPGAVLGTLHLESQSKRFVPVRDLQLVLSGKQVL